MSWPKGPLDFDKGPGFDSLCDIKTKVFILNEKSFSLINREGSWCYFLIVCRGRIPDPITRGSLRHELNKKLHLHRDKSNS